MDKTGVELIAEERIRQVVVERWSTKHDDDHDEGELALAAVCYASPQPLFVKTDLLQGVSFIDPWPWDHDSDSDKRSFMTENDPQELIPNADVELPLRRRMLVKAGALIAAEIDRLNRCEEEDNNESVCSNCGGNGCCCLAPPHCGCPEPSKGGSL